MMLFVPLFLHLVVPRECFASQLWHFMCMLTYSFALDLTTDVKETAYTVGSVKLKFVE